MQIVDRKARCLGGQRRPDGGEFVAEMIRLPGFAGALAQQQAGADDGTALLLRGELGLDPRRQDRHHRQRQGDAGAGFGLAQ